MSGAVTGTSQTYTYGTQTTGPNSADSTQSATQTTGVSPGAAGAAGGVTPDIELATQSIVAASVLVASLILFMPQMADSDQEVFLAEVIQKLKDTQAETDKGELKADANKKRESINAQTAVLEEAQKKQDEAKEKMKNASIWDKIKLAFQFLAAIVSIVIGAVLIATGVGAVLGGLMIAGGVVGLICGIDAALKMDNGYGIAARCMPNASAEDRAKADMIFGITCAAIGIAIGIATVVVGFTSAAASIASALDKITEMAATIDKVINVAQAVITIGVAIGDIAAGSVRYEASKQLAESMEDRADGKRYEAAIQLIEDLMDQVIQRMIAHGNMFNQMLDSLTDALQDTGKSMSQAKLTA